MKHKEHKKKRLYARDQSSAAKQWEKTKYSICECGALLEESEREVNKKRTEVKK